MFYKFEDIPGLPPGILMRFHKVIKQQASQKILAAYNDLLQKGLVFPQTDAALQIGVWKTSPVDGTCCEVTADFHGHAQNQEVMDAMDSFLLLIRTGVISRILTSMAEGSKEQSLQSAQ